jgi:hypothetical protein
MDFAFMWALTDNYKHPDKSTDCIVTSYNGHTAHLLIVDSASCCVWAFLTKSEDPPLDILRVFMAKFGLSTGVIRTDQGKELAQSASFWEMMLKDLAYAVKPTGADSPSQNGGAEIYNNTLAAKLWTLFYGAGFPAKFWSAALLHAVYLYNRLVHLATYKTPYEGWYGRKSDIAHLKTFGSWVCVKRTGSRGCKLDCHDFTGIFLGDTATDQNITYLDLNSGIVKIFHHAIFNEAWYLQPTRPPAAQLLYDLGLEAETEFMSCQGPLHPTTPGTITPVSVLWPPLQPGTILNAKTWKTLPLSLYAPLPLQVTETPHTVGARAARARSPEDHRSKKDLAAKVVSQYLIGTSNMAMIYVSPDLYGTAFEEKLNLRKFDLQRHATAGLCIFEKDNRILLASMAPSTPGTRIPWWRTCLCGAWLIQINATPVASIYDAKTAFANLFSSNSQHCTLLFSHLEITPDISNQGLPVMSKSDFSQFTHDQLNNRINFIKDGLRTQRQRKYDVVDSDNVLNYTTRVMKLTHGKLLKQDDWIDWQELEYLQLDQYDAQGMFGTPVSAKDDKAIFHLVWTHAIKALAGQNEACCVCDGSTPSGSVQILDKTYANCIDQTSSCLFYAIAAAENLLIFGVNVSNAFAKAPLPKQGFYICPDKAFHKWWTKHKQQPPIPLGHIIPILSAMQGHPESPRLWEKHADAILRELGLTPTVHKPCLYSGVITGQRVIFK